MLLLGNTLSIEAICSIADSSTAFSFNFDQNLRDRVAKNYAFFNQSIAQGAAIYGVTTGLGASSKNTFDATFSAKLQRNLFSYHGCGVGPKLAEPICAAIMLLRLHTLTKGQSGIRPQLIEYLANMLTKRVIAAIPSKGSVGASGDLTPLSYVAASMTGQRQCYYQGELMPSDKALRAANLSTYDFQGREVLAIMNGTSAMTAILSFCWQRSQKLADIACDITGLLAELMQARTAPFIDKLHACKPHPGQQKAADRILALLYFSHQRLYQGAASNDLYNDNAAIQDVYSIRCAPQLVGVLYDTLSWTKMQIEIEANSINDNPVFIDQDELILNGGNFFGGHMALAADALKIAVANTINLMDRQLALILEPKNTPFLSENLRFPSGDEDFLRHGFKAMQITMSALAAEIAKKAQPMATFSRPTESSNQDVVSMGTTAAVDLDEILGLSELACSIMVMAICQSFYVLKERGFHAALNKKAEELLASWQSQFAPVIDDRAMDQEIETMRNFLFATYQYR